jgi:hypothetical protein
MSAQYIITIGGSLVDQMLSVGQPEKVTIDLLELDPLRQSFRSLVILLHVFCMISELVNLHLSNRTHQ